MSWGTWVWSYCCLRHPLALPYSTLMVSNCFYQKQRRYLFYSSIWCNLIRQAGSLLQPCLFVPFLLPLNEKRAQVRLRKKNVTWLLKHCHRPKFFVFSLSPSEHLGKLCQRLYDIPCQCPFLSFLLLVANITEQWSCIIIITIFYFVFYCLMGGIWIGSLFINSYLFKLFPIILFSEHVVSSMMLLHSCLKTIFLKVHYVGSWSPQSET